MKAQDTVFYQKLDRIFNPNSETLIMGILNITPDSFSDGGKYTTKDSWLQQAKKIGEEGADIIDIGGYSTRPGAVDITEQEEEQRLIPAILSVRELFPELLISADTFRSNIAVKAIQAGANIINDISGGTIDKEMLDMVAKLNVPYILSHIQGTPQTMQNNPTYNNVTDEVIQFWQTRIDYLKTKGFHKIILDPGFGFGKTAEHNFKLISDLHQFSTLPYPFMVGFSKKSFTKLVAQHYPSTTMDATDTLNALAITANAKIIRVHDVIKAKQLIERLKSNK